MKKLFVALSAACLCGRVAGAELSAVSGVPGQPLGANVRRAAQALEFLGHPLPSGLSRDLADAAERRDATAIQNLLDSRVLFAVHINPELRVKVGRGPAPAVLYQSGYTPVLIKVLNDGTVSERLRIASPQAGPVYAGASEGILRRQQQTELNENPNAANDPNRFIDVDMFSAPPMTEHLSGLAVEYAIGLIYSKEAGRLEATVGFNIGQGTQDLGFRSEVPVLFDIMPAIPVALSIRDQNGSPTAARLTFKDPLGRVYPPQPKRLAPDLFFQPQVYRKDGDTVLLPPGRFELTATRGPEYREQILEVAVPSVPPARIEIQLERWIDPMRFGYASGDHHIHAAGCSHYQIPTAGVSPRDMFLQVKGEGLNVGCVLTWGPCFEFQRQFFSDDADAVSEPLTILKYDLEISGFGSEALGHVCLLNLKDQNYPGSDGTKSRGWPTWTVPVMRWAKEQGGVTGYPHSDMFVDSAAYAERWMRQRDRNGDGAADRPEARDGLLPKAFEEVDADGDGRLSERELAACADRAAQELPHLVLPSMRGAGAMEIFVSTAEGVCDFISTMNTARIGEWNTWYHLLNSGFPVKLSGETDFPCMSGTRVGQGRVYVKMAAGPLSNIDFAEWCCGLRDGRSYVSDGFAHALHFTVDGISSGTNIVRLVEPGTVNVRAEVAFAPEVPKGVAHGTLETDGGAGVAGDTRLLHGPRPSETVRGGQRRVEIVQNGLAVAEAIVPADGQIHELSFQVEIERSSWLALRQFPQLHTNPVEVRIAEKPIRASRNSARWCAESIDLLWENRSRHIAPEERAAARAAYDRAIQTYLERAREAPPGS